MRRSQTRLALAVVLLGGCGPQPRAKTPPERAADKAAVYGDAALIPTRTGERARAEVALAEEVRLGLEALHPVERARVSVRSAADGTPEAAAIVMRLTTPEGEETLRASARRIARATLGEDAELVVETSSQRISEDVEDRPHPTWLLLLVVLGLGISVGLTLDRARGVLRRRARRR